jgi:multidrug efflux pump subunit AcrB
MISIFLSFIGVFLGLMITGWPFVIMMTMMGIISLAGIVVNNSVVLIDYVDILKLRRIEQLGIDNDKYLIRKEDQFNAIVQAGKARLRPGVAHSNYDRFRIDTASDRIEY